MFTNRYMTKGVQSKIPVVLQIFMWNCISAIPVQKDYLQIFRLSESNGKQKIVHEQEVPEFNREYLLAFPNPITTKVYVIDDGDHCTILYFVEHHWLELLKFSRRSEATMNRWAARYGYESTPKAIMDKAKKNCCGRYAAVNLCNYHTVEFRMFRGTLKLNTLMVCFTMTILSVKKSSCRKHILKRIAMLLSSSLKSGVS